MLSVKALALGFLSFVFLISCNKSSDGDATRTTPLVCKDGELVNGIIGGKPLTDDDVLGKNIALIVIIRKEKDDEGNRKIAVCTGTLIDKNIILTAAHCLKDVYSSYAAFSADAACKVRDGKMEMIREVNRAVVHSDYNPKKWYFADIAILRIENVAPEGFSPSGLLFEDVKLDTTSQLLVAGYGNEIEYDNEDSKMRLKVAEVSPYKLQLDVSGEEEVEAKSMNNSPRIYIDQRNGQGVCNGDSGGPLYVQTDAGLKLAGVTSYGRAIGKIQFDEKGGVSCKEGAVFTSIFYFKKWITDNYNTLKNSDSIGTLAY